jgi:uncharacterized repeat protein (TIGR03987 family)
MLTIAISFIFAALALYSVGVWAEKIGGRLKVWQAIVFWCGLVCDTIGTGAMGRIAGGVFQLNFHGITGLLAIILMIFHASWATIVLACKDERLIKDFHILSVFVWCVWLIPMIGGIVFGSMA